MPTESIWVQFSVVAIVILAIGIIWRELKKFIDDQDAKREKERETQRTWQEKQDLLRDQRWQAFLKSMQDSWIIQDEQRGDVLEQLTAAVNQHIEKVDAFHDTVKTAIVVMQERTKPR
jgi:hypothetical protein